MLPLSGRVVHSPPGVLEISSVTFHAPRRLARLGTGSATVQPAKNAETPAIDIRRAMRATLPSASIGHAPNRKRLRLPAAALVVHRATALSKIEITNRRCRFLRRAPV